MQLLFILGVGCSTSLSREILLSQNTLLKVSVEPRLLGPLQHGAASVNTHKMVKTFLFHLQGTNSVICDNEVGLVPENKCFMILTFPALEQHFYLLGHLSCTAGQVQNDNCLSVTAEIFGNVVCHMMWYFKLQSHHILINIQKIKT